MTGSLDLESDLATQGLAIDPSQKNIFCQWHSKRERMGKISRMACLLVALIKLICSKSGILGFIKQCHKQPGAW